MHKPDSRLKYLPKWLTATEKREILALLKTRPNMTAQDAVDRIACLHARRIVFAGA